MDYITDSSSDEDKLSEDDRAQIYQEQGVDEEAGLKALLTDISRFPCSVVSKGLTE